MTASAGACSRVLVLEDDSGIRSLLRRTLEREGYEVFDAGNYAEARVHLSSGRVELLVLDYQLAGQENGLEFYRQLQHEHRDLPAILVTGFSDEGRILEALRAGLRDLIPKTPNFVELVAPTILRVLAQVQQERRLKEAEAASRAKDNFLATLSHELRTPLTPVLALVSTIRQDQRLPPDIREDLEVIHRNVALEARLIDDLLDLTRIAKGKLELRTETVDLAPLIEHALKTAFEEARLKSIVWVKELNSGPLTLVGDPARLTQIFWNVLKNAVKFTPEGGEIHVASRLESAGSAPLALVTIRDSGIGISPEALPHIFDAFEQGGRDITKDFGGLGLGLAISKALVDLHGGQISAASEGPGRGATFLIRLPVSQLGAQGQASGSEKLAVATFETPVDHSHLLLVEDHADTASIMTRMLKRAGYQVTAAGRIDEALAKVTALHAAGDHPLISLVISDLGLPDGSGIDLMRQLRAQFALQGIALSGYGMEEDVRQARAAGFVRHLTKPVEFATLLSAVQEALSSGRETSPTQKIGLAT